MTEVSGRLAAEVVQACVVTLEPVVSKIEQDIDQIFVPEGSKLARIVTDEAGEYYYAATLDEHNQNVAAAAQNGEVHGTDVTTEEVPT